LKVEEFTNDFVDDQLNFPKKSTISYIDVEILLENDPPSIFVALSQKRNNFIHSCSSLTGSFSFFKYLEYS
jgi:hypothetical protein